MPLEGIEGMSVVNAGCSDCCSARQRSRLGCIDDKRLWLLLVPADRSSSEGEVPTTSRCCCPRTKESTDRDFGRLRIIGDS